MGLAATNSGFGGTWFNGFQRGKAAGLLGPWSARLDNRFDLDASLVERCLTGDESAWEDLVKVHSRRVYGICYRFTGKESEAQDLTQEVFLRIFKSIKSFRAGGFIHCVGFAVDAQPADRQLPANKNGSGFRFH